MDIIEITPDNIESEHLCCAISDKKSTQVKRAWIKERMQDGYRFYKMDGQGKAFIECIPAERAWAPISASGYLFIDCFWVSGSFAKRGYGTQRLNVCTEEAKRMGKRGLVALSSDKKRPFLSDPKFYQKRGFLAADTAQPYFELLYLPFEKGVETPCFLENAKEGRTEEQGLAIYYTDHYPWNAKYVPLLKKAAQERSVKITFIHLTAEEEAQACPCPFTTYAVYYNGAFVTNEMMSEKKFIKFLEEKGF